MKTLEALRTELDATDEALVDLFKRRFAIVDAIAAAKHAAGLQVLDAKREDQVMQHIRSYADADLRDDLVTLWHDIMTIAKARERRRLEVEG